MTDIELGPIRPPSESQSLLIRVTRGCHWNKCFAVSQYIDNLKANHSIVDFDKVCNFCRADVI